MFGVGTAQVDLSTQAYLSFKRQLYKPSDREYEVVDHSFFFVGQQPWFPTLQM